MPCPSDAKQACVNLTDSVCRGTHTARTLLLLGWGALFLSGCAGLEPGVNPNFWTQCVKFQAWGVSAVTTWGPVNLGWTQYERNVACEKEQKVSQPGIPTP